VKENEQISLINGNPFTSKELKYRM